MIEIYQNLYVGTQEDYEVAVETHETWCVVHACRSPYHCLAVTYSPLETVPPDHPEYLVARRGNRLMLNLVDARDPGEIPKEAIDAALAFIDRCLSGGRQVLVHCGFGVSRSAAIGLLYLAAYTDVLPTEGFAEAEEAYRRIYPPYKPGRGIRGFLAAHWDEYAKRRVTA
ncbi:phosphatase [Methanoculleus sp. Afa-1]|jgi:protein-tyrosine phosphatase|uniref:Phosphatase n=1 Tax=Methanoculleus formosensis TaxID=2590886 RepID=A0A9E4ZI37_9EURY|nr:dual specificity protein phosphatase family protein [Methanoculleus sp. Afa-1]MCT8336005.1 phosphatase [Methanoculleus sp. Afa-1]